MLLAYENLDEATRKFMLEEIEHDLSNGALYLGKRLSPKGEADYPNLLTEAARSHDDEWLAGQLNLGDRLKAMEERRTKSGTTMAKVPVNAHETLAEGEFNRFYIRALCRRAIAEALALVVYRAKAVSTPRSESQAKIGQQVDPTKLLADLRDNPGVDTALGLPAGPNSGLSVKLA